MELEKKWKEHTDKLVLLFALLGLQTFAKPCISGMKCVASTNTCFIVIGIILMGLVALEVLEHTKKCRITLLPNLLLLFCSFFLVYGIFLFAWCKKMDMACITNTIPFLFIIAVYCFVSALIGLLTRRKKQC